MAVTEAIVARPALVAVHIYSKVRGIVDLLKRLILPQGQTAQLQGRNSSTQATKPSPLSKLKPIVRSAVLT